MIVFDCEHCGRRIRFKEEHAGRKARCPKCFKTITIPPDDDAAEKSEEPPKPSLTLPHPLLDSHPVPAVKPTNRHVAPAHTQLIREVITVSIAVLFGAMSINGTPDAGIVLGIIGFFVSIGGLTTRFKGFATVGLILCAIGVALAAYRIEELNKVQRSLERLQNL